MINLLAPSTYKLQISPNFGFSATTVYGASAPAASVTFTLTNTSSSSVSWNVGGGASWLGLPSSGTVIPAHGSTQATVFLATAAGNLPVGTYNTMVTFTDPSTGYSQNRLFVLTVSAGAHPLAVSGFNASVVVPATGTAIQPFATALDTLTSFTFYAAGLAGSSRGLPAGGRFVSGWDGQTVFQFGAYGSDNALVLGRNNSLSGTLTLASPQALNSLVVLATSTYATATSQGTLVLNYSGGGHSQTFNFNAPDWFGPAANSALRGVGRIILNNFAIEDDGDVNPELYQTTIPLAALGITQTIASITFTAPTNATNTGIFAVSGVSGALSGLLPVITTQPPPSVTNADMYDGVAFSVSVSGAPPFSYQWYSNSVPLPYAITPTLSLAPDVSNDAAAYYVVVSNEYGTAQSGLATLTINRTPPQWTGQPAVTNYTVFVGDTVSLAATASSVNPILYSWEFNGVALPGATNTTLVLNNLQATNAGIYTLLASSVNGTAASDPVTVNVVPIPSAVYPQAVLQLNPLAYWRLDETGGGIAYDYVGGDNGFYTNVVLGQPGYRSATGTGTDPSELAAQFGPTNNAQSYVGLPNLDLSVPNGGNGEFTILAWVLASNTVPVTAGIVAKGYGNGDEEFGLACGANGNDFQFFIRNALSGAASLANSSVPPDNHWHLLAGVCDQANSKIYLYVDGTNAAQGAVTPGTGIHYSTYQGSIGARASKTGQPEDLQFIGLIDDVAVITNALSAAQVSFLYGTGTYGPTIRQQPVSPQKIQSGSTLTNAIVATGTNLAYQWYGPAGAIAGATNSSFVLPNIQPAATGYYYATVGNVYATLQSSNSLVVVLPSATSRYAQSVLALNPLAYWRLDETNGTVAYDYANFNEGTYYNVLLGQPGYGSASPVNADPTELAAGFISNGVPSYVSIPSIDLSVPVTDPVAYFGEFSIAAWVKASPAVANGAGIIAKGAGNGDEQFCLDCGGPNNAFRFLVRDARYQVAYSVSSSVVPDNHWHLLIGVCDQFHQTNTLYIDGTNAAFGFMGQTGIHATAVSASMGARESGTNQPENLQFIGDLDDVAIFTNVLTPTQVNYLYEDGRGIPAIQSPITPFESAIVGGVFTNQVVADGADLDYQWFGPAGAILNATNSALVFSNVTYADAGNYYVVVSNLEKTIQSSNSLLTVLPRSQYASSFGSYPPGTTAFSDLSQLFSTAVGSVAEVVSDSGQSSELRLTEMDIYNVTSAFELPDLDPGTPSYAFSAKWNSMVFSDFDPYAADGFSFNFGQLSTLNLINGAVESGYPTGLCFSVQTDSRNNPGFYLRLNGHTLAAQTYDGRTQWGSENLTRHYFEVDWNYANGMSVWLDHAAIFTNVATPGFVPQAGDQFVWAARCDNISEEIRLANIVVVTGGNLVPVPGQSPLFADPNTLASNPASNAFAASPPAPWETATNFGYVGATLSPSVPLKAYALTSSTNTGVYDPETWTVQGSGNGGVTWSNVAGTTDYFVYGLETRTWLTSDSTDSFGAYRLDVAANRGANETALQGLTFYQFNAVPGPSVTTEPVTQVSLSTAQLNGQANPASLPTTAWFQWGATTGYGNTTAAQNLGSGITNVAFNAALNGLTPGAAYHSQAVISNQFGLFFGGDAVFTTTANPIVFNGNGFGWSANQNEADPTPVMTNNVLHLTDAVAGEARSTFYQLPQSIGAFQAAFAYQDVSGGGADGVTFILQNDSRGLLALGGAGGSLGVGSPTPITPSAELELNIYNGNGEKAGYTFLTNGLTGAGGANGNYQAPGAINLAGGDPINITVNYAGGQMSLNFTDTVAHLSFSTNLNVGNLTGIVGASTAYIGFTAGDGSATSTQIITNFSFVSIPTVAVTGGSLLISWPSVIAGYTLQTTTNLAFSAWVNITNQPLVVNGQNQVSVPVSPVSTFYRLTLP